MSCDKAGKIAPVLAGLAHLGLFYLFCLFLSIYFYCCLFLSVLSVFRAKIAPVLAGLAHLANLGLYLINVW